MQQNLLIDIARWSERPGPRGIPSVCSAHPLVIEAAMLRALKEDAALLIEATCNQVNQDGGYTGMTPADFTRFVAGIADRVAFPKDKIILGGDHLGPNPWKHLAAEEAMAKAETMIEAYAKAGFTKLHLDTSMGCAGEPVALPDAVTAERAARLAAAAEAAIRGENHAAPVYIIGTEVPVPAGHWKSSTRWKSPHPRRRSRPSPFIARRLKRPALPTPSDVSWARWSSRASSSATRT